MKKRNIILLASLALVALMVAVSCQKSRYCLCITDETVNGDTVIVNMDRGNNCKRIMQLGIQKQDAGGYRVDSIHTYTCTKINKDSLSLYPGLHVQ